MAKLLAQGDHGPEIKSFQEALNRRAQPRFYPPIMSDGALGPMTLYSFRAVGYALGLTAQTINAPQVSVGAQRIIEEPTTRNAEQLARARERAPKLHMVTVGFDGTPLFWGLAKALTRARARGWTGTLQSGDRRKGVPERFGKRSQDALFRCFERRTLLGRCPPECAGNCNAANRPGASSHECRSDGSRAFGGRPAGTKLAWWELGLDVSATQELLKILKQLGYSAILTYPDNPQESHHINFTANPGRVLPGAGPNHEPPVEPTPTPPVSKPSKRVLTGIDVSNHQPNVDWERVKGAGHDFAFVKVSEGLGAADKAFGPGRWKAMKDAGIVRGTYHFARPQVGRDPRDEVHEFLRLINKAGGFEDGDLFPVLDIEDYGAAGKLSAAKTLEWARGFVEEMEDKLGRRPIIYTGVFWREQMGNPADNLDCPLWLAAYVKDAKQYVPKAWTASSFSIWQHTDKGSCPGVPGNIDMNRIPGGEKALRKLRF